MWTLTINGIDIYHIISWFLIYSFLGWVWETAYVSLKEGEFINRGFINGPLCTIYGHGAVTVYLILKPLEDNTILLYFGGMIVATLLEYFTAVLMEAIFHTSWWDYSDQKFNFQGRICLGASLGWGFFTVILFRVLHPAVEKFVDLWPVFTGEVCICVILLIYILDFCYSASAAFRLRDRIPQWERQLERKQVELMLRVNEKMNSLEFARGESLENIRNRMEDLDFIRTINERRQALLDDVSAELRSYRKSLASRVEHNTARFLKSYPHLNRGYRLRHNKDKKHKRS